MSDKQEFFKVGDEITHKRKPYKITEVVPFDPSYISSIRTAERNHFHKCAYYMMVNGKYSEATHKFVYNWKDDTFHIMRSLSNA